MNFREKLVVQTVICLMIFAGVKSVSMADIQLVNKAEKYISEQIDKHYEPDDLQNVFSDAYEQISGIHKTVTAAVIRANTDEKPDNVLGQEDEQGKQIVYAARGGDVLNAGFNEEKGFYVEVLCDDYIYCYGNLAEISVITGERARKGDIIGTYDSKGEKEFFFEKSENL